VHVSAATVWELTIKAVLGKLTVPTDLSKRLTGQGLELLSTTAEHAEAIRDFPELIRHNPFDRLIVAQASRAGLQLLTADHVLLNLRRDFILDASRQIFPADRIR
jgi:PIN domain nuclease of toxin-antitoxin system